MSHKKIDMDNLISKTLKSLIYLLVPVLTWFYLYTNSKNTTITIVISVILFLVVIVIVSAIFFPADKESIEQSRNYPNQPAIDKIDPIIAQYAEYKRDERLHRISKKLSTLRYINESGEIDLTKILSSKNNKKEELILELIEFAKSDDKINNLLMQTNTENVVLSKIYHKLTSIGTGQYTSGHHVTSSSLSHFYTLKYLIEHFDGEEFSIDGLDSYNSGLQIAYRLILYFENEEKTEII